MRGNIMRAAVHPRACGERISCCPLNLAHGGSSPRLRGTDGAVVVLSRADRFIPAPAGNGNSMSVVICSPSVHPRACGERSTEIGTSGLSDGSSPRLRGTERQRSRGLSQLRFIPAPAGNGTARTRHLCAIAVHPRACGERHPPAFHMTQGRGSSPRLRGTDYLHIGVILLARFIPAPAGNGRSLKEGPHTSTVHPRACGERINEPDAVQATAGSSPRLRGTALVAYSGAAYQRFIPAPAGNGRCGPCCRRCRTVHPRACGERWRR